MGAKVRNYKEFFMNYFVFSRRSITTWVILVILSAVFLALAAQQITAVQATPTGSLDVSYINFFPNLTFNDPVDIANAGDDRLFIVEQQGIIRVTPLDSGSTSAPTFLNIIDRVNDNGSEMGLLGLAFHPQYASNGYFYVNYTYGTGQLYTRISRFSVTADPNVADPNSELVLLQIVQPYTNHNGGDLNFGPDGYLYIGMGDGGDGGDPQNYGQTLTTLLGKMLRIDVDPTGGNAPDCGSGNNYSIPADNPFVGVTGCDEIWAYGVRNPWRFSFDSLTGDMYIGEVGQNAWEEIDFQPVSSSGGENYGWRCYEGNHPYNTNGCSTNPDDYAWPILEYSHSLGLAVTGGYVYRGSQYPFLKGYYIYGDYITRNMWAATPDGGGGWINIVLPDVTGSPSSFGEDAYGELYVAYHGSSGRIYRIQENTPAVVLSIDKTAPSAVPIGDPITYTLTIQNSGALSATNLIITDVLPVGATYLSGGTLVGDVVSWTVPSLASQSSVEVEFAVTTNQTITNEVYGVAADGGFSATGDVPVVTAVLVPELHIAKTAPTSRIAGLPITYTLSITNSGTLTATNLVITDVLPVGASFVSSDGGLNGNTVTWNLAELADGDSATFHFVVTATQTITNTLYGVTAENAPTATGETAVVTTLLSPLAIEKTAPNTAESGQLITYTLTIHNLGGFALSGLVISDTLPAGASYVNGGTLDGSVVTWTVPSLASGGIITVQFAVTTTETITNEFYTVTANGGYSATGDQPIITLIDPVFIYLPVIIRP